VSGETHKNENMDVPFSVLSIAYTHLIVAMILLVNETKRPIEFCHSYVASNLARPLKLGRKKHPSAAPVYCR